MYLNKNITHRAFYEFLRTKIDIPSIEKTFFSAEYDHTLFRLTWKAGNKCCEATLGCHGQPFLLLVSDTGYDKQRVHILVQPEELYRFGLIEQFANPRFTNTNEVRFFFIDSDYIQALKNAELAVYKHTHVPDVNYAKHPKFLLGNISLPNSVFKYAIPISSTNAVGIGNIPIVVNGDITPRKGSLRISFMIPAPEQVLTPVNIGSLEPIDYRNLVRKQYFALKPLRDHISRSAAELYEIVTQTKSCFAQGCCDFHLLEYACHNYCVQHGIPSPSMVSPTTRHSIDFHF